jgi:RIO kinase 1
VPHSASSRRGKRRFDDDDQTFAKRARHRPSLPASDALDAVDGLPAGHRWSTWDQSASGQRGPRPYPGWLVTDLG